MSVREIVSDDYFLGWPICQVRGANRQVVYLYLGADDEVVSEEKDNGETTVRAVNWQWERTYSPGLEPVIIRRPRR